MSSTVRAFDPEKVRAASSLSICFSSIGVATASGITRVTATPRDRSSVAAARVKPRTANLEAL